MKPHFISFSLPVLVLCLSTLVHGQGDYQLEVTFDDCMPEDIGPAALDVTVLGDPMCTCAPGSDAFVLDGTQDAFLYADSTLALGPAFTLSFVFRSDDEGDNQRMIAYKQNCTSQVGMEVTYQGSRDLLEVGVFESLTNQFLFEIPLDPRRCWHAVSIIKSGATLIAFLYGEEVFRTQATTLIDVGDANQLFIGTGPCVPQFANKFEGAFDYVSVYDDVLPTEEIRRLNYISDRIVTPDTVIFLGGAVTPVVDAPCATGFSWRPTTNVDNVNIAMPTITPEEQRSVYYLEITSGGCMVEDSIRITVVDTADVSCDELVLPTAFTPNGDNLNDVYFISNGYAVDELIRFEIFDRWGGRVFSATTIDQTWDGAYEGEPVMPGVYMYKIEYKCEGEDRLQTGSLSVLN